VNWWYPQDTKRFLSNKRNFYQFLISFSIKELKQIYKEKQIVSKIGLHQNLSTNYFPYWILKYIKFRDKVNSVHINQRNLI
jgi:hypothetical protein